MAVFLVALLVHQADRAATLHRELVGAARALETEGRRLVSRYSIYDQVWDRVLRPTRGEAVTQLPLLPRLTRASRPGPIDLSRNPEVDEILATIAQHAHWLEVAFGPDGLAAMVGASARDPRNKLIRVLQEQQALEQRSTLLGADMADLTIGGRAALETLLARFDRYSELRAEIHEALGPAVFRWAVGLMAILGATCMALPLMRLAEKIGWLEFTTTLGTLAFVFVATLVGVWIRSGALREAALISQVELRGHDPAQ